MAKFPIERATGTLPGRGTGVRANVDVRTGEGELAMAVGQAGLEELARRKEKRDKVELKRQEMRDSRATSEFRSLMNTAEKENIAFRSTESDTTKWTPDLEQRFGAIKIENMNASDERKALLSAEHAARLEGASADSFVAETRRDVVDTKEASISSVVEAYTNGTPIEQFQASKAFLNIAPTIGMGIQEATATLKTAIMAGQKARGQNAVQTVHAAIEAGDFELARELAKNQFIPETQQTTLRNAIRSAEQEVKRVATGKAIVTNQEEKGNLEDMAYGIWTGAIRKSDYDEALIDARYPVEGEPIIDDKAFDELKSLGARELKTTQAKGLAEAQAYGKGQIVQVSDELAWGQLLAGLKGKDKIQAQSERQEQLQRWSEYNRSMRVWVSEQKEPNEGDIYIESRTKLPFYRTQADNVGPSLPPDLEGRGNRVGITKEQFDKLPSGAVYTAPDGTTRRKP